MLMARLVKYCLINGCNRINLTGGKTREEGVEKQGQRRGQRGGVNAWERQENVESGED